MFILTRKIGERVILGDDIVVELVSIVGGRVKLGIYAPPNVSIKRNEVGAGTIDKPKEQIKRKKCHIKHDQSENK